MVDTTWFRRLLTTTHLKLLFDGFKSYTQETMTAGYGTAKFVEAVYEATVEATLQCYKAFQDHADGKGLSAELLFSVGMSFNAIATALMLFLEPNVTFKFDCAEGLPYLGLYLYHVVEIAFRVFSFSLLGFASMQSYGRITFAALFVVIVLRTGIRRFFCAGMPVGMLVAAVFVDSAWPDIASYRTGSALTILENALFVIWPTVYLLPTSTAQSVGIISGLLLVVRVLLWWGMMEESRSWSRYYKKKAAFEVDYQDEIPEVGIENAAGALESGDASKLADDIVPSGMVEGFLENLT
jgi:hypothetical protein